MGSGDLGKAPPHPFLGLWSMDITGMNSQPLLLPALSRWHLSITSQAFITPNHLPPGQAICVAGPRSPAAGRACLAWGIESLSRPPIVALLIVYIRVC